MNHFGRQKNVKKTQDACFQHIITFSKFACTRPSDFYFKTMALSEAQNALFVSKIQIERNTWIQIKPTGIKNR
jgi:hypothetical protein